MTEIVSVIIPTTGRSSLERAVRSVVEQTFDGVIEVLVVWDGTADAKRSSSLERRSTPMRQIAVISLGRNFGGAYARNEGIKRASGGLVAYLDDDDIWLPDKCRLQVVEIQRLENLNLGQVVCASRVEYVTHSAETDEYTTIGRGPKKTVASTQDPFTYLFHRRSPTTGRAAIPTSCLMMRASLARETEWRVGLRRHQDWDLLVRLSRAGAKFAAVPQVLVAMTAQSDGSISSSADWEASLAWADQIRSMVQRKDLADFLAANTLRYAFQARSLRGVRKSLKAIARCRHAPSIPCLAFGLGGAIPRFLVLRVMSARGNRNAGRHLTSGGFDSRPNNGSRTQ